MKFLYPLLSFLVMSVCPTKQSLAQPAENPGFITYDTTFNVGYGGLSYLLHISRPANADTAARPAFIAMNGAGEAGTSDVTNRYGPGYWLENGWDGSVQLGNGKHYPILITVQPNQYWPQTTELLMVLKFILNTYHIKKNSVHLCGLSMGAFAWSSLICHQSAAGGEDGMKLVTSLVCLQGQSNTVSAAVASNELPGYTSFGHWAKKYHGKFFGLEGTIDYRNVGAISGNMNDSVPGSAYFSYETLGGGAHCSWNDMYNPAATNWTATGTLGPNNTQGASPNAMGTYKASMNLFQWMLRQGDTSLVLSTLPSHTPPVVDPGGKVTTYLPFNNPTMGGNATASGGSIVAYSWTKVSGPLQYTISNPAIANPVISNLVIGNYVFKLTAMDNMGYSSDSNVAISVNAANSINQTVSPSPIPGKILADSYFSMYGVGTIASNDIGGGLYVGAIHQGSWMNYYVNVATAGRYAVSFRVAAGNTSTGLQMRTANGTVLGSFTVPFTGSYTTWQTITDTVVLPAGIQTLQLIATNTAHYNINWMQFTLLPPAATIPGTIQAENFDAMSNVLTQPTTDVGGGLNVGGIYKGSSMSYNVSVAGPGTYTASFRIATPSNGASFQVKLADGTVLATVNLPNTGNYQAWQTVSTNITIPGGNQTIQVVSTSTANWNFNWMQFSTLAATAAPIPGTIQAENFDAMSGVLTQPTTDVGGGLNVGGIFKGDWMSYNVNVAGPGTYTASFRIATPSNGASLQLKLADGTVLANVSLPNTGNYQAWQTVSTNITIPGGNQTIQVVSTSTANWNFNWMQFSTLSAAAAAALTAAPIPGTIQAESFNSMSGVLTQPTTDVGGGLNVGGIFKGDWMSYNVNVAGPGTYKASFRIATPSNGASFQLKLANGTVLATVNLPNTGNYQAWQTVSTNITIPGGYQTIQVVSTSAANWNFNWMQFSTLTAAARTSSTVNTAVGKPLSADLQQDSVNIPSANARTSFNLYPNPVQDHFTIEIDNAFTGPMTVQVISQSGAIIRTYTSQKDGQFARQDVNCGGLAAGLYLVRVQIGNGWAIVKKWVKL